MLLFPKIRQQYEATAHHEFSLAEVITPPWYFYFLMIDLRRAARRKITLIHHYLYQRDNGCPGRQGGETFVLALQEQTPGSQLAVLSIVA